MYSNQLPSLEPPLIYVPLQTSALRALAAADQGERGRGKASAGLHWPSLLVYPPHPHYKMGLGGG